jgi:hypothetical protein
VGGDEGEGDGESIEILLFITPTPTLPHQGGGSIFDFLQNHQLSMNNYRCPLIFAL